MSAIRVRRVDTTQPATAALLQWLQLEVLPHDQPLPPDEGAWWVAYDGASPVAFASVRPSAQFGDCGYLSRAGVLSSHRGRGLQKRLIRVREQYARRQGWRWLLTDTAPGNSPSANSLITCGFRLYTPTRPWGLQGACYWRKPILQEQRQHG